MNQKEQPNQGSNPQNEPRQKYGKQKPKGNSLDSMGKIKKRIRDVNRTLKKGARTAKIRVESERRIRALEYELGEKTIDAQEQKNATAYHQVKHIERKKAERKLAQATAALKAASEDDKEAAEKMVEERKIDLLYTKHFPKSLPYVSILSKNDEESKNTTREEVREKIREAMKNGEDFKDMQKFYRDKCRAWLEKRKKIPAAKPVDVDEEGPVDDKMEEDQDSDAEKDSKKDDFFE
ncbi:hypothetical protein CLU79DRAFT_732073 [Phycomyces nitens]|nr:hypothetical protein CLU79DRAFT_732073 [Phycomyces nitens]